MAFSLECFLKIIALTPIIYLRDNWNKFDFFIVIVSLIEMNVEEVKGGLSGLRTLRLVCIRKIDFEIKLEFNIAHTLTDVRVHVVLTLFIEMICFHKICICSFCFMSRIASHLQAGEVVAHTEHVADNHL